MIYEDEACREILQPTFTLGNLKDNTIVLARDTAFDPRLWHKSRAQ